MTLVSEIAPLGIDARRLGDLERLARDARPGLSAAELRDKLKAITVKPPVFPIAVTAIAVGVASGAFSYLNNGGPYEIAAALSAAVSGNCCAPCCSGATSISSLSPLCARSSPRVFIV